MASWSMKWLPLRRGIADLRRRAELSRAANARYLDGTFRSGSGNSFLSVVGSCQPDESKLNGTIVPCDRLARKTPACFKSFCMANFLYKAFVIETCGKPASRSKN